MYFWWDFNFADFISQPRNCEIFIPKKWYLLCLSKSLEHVTARASEPSSDQRMPLLFTYTFLGFFVVFQVAF